MNGEETMDIDMKEQDDIWLKQWKDCLEDFEEEIPVNGWERLQADLHANAPLDKVEVSKAKVIPFRSWRVVAAAAVVVLFAGAGIWFLASDKAIQVPSIDSSVAQVTYKEIHLLRHRRPLRKSVRLPRLLFLYQKDKIYLCRNLS